MKVLRQRLGGAVHFVGIGGRSMAREGLTSLFPIEELSIMGLAAVVKQLPMILRRIRETAAAVTDASPDILLIIDSPDFTHRVARRVRARDPSIPIVDYVSPVGLGVAAGAGARDAPLCRSRPGLAAVRA
jgi:Lipid A disaccharide synthetase